MSQRRPKWPKLPKLISKGVLPEQNYSSAVVVLIPYKYLAENLPENLVTSAKFGLKYTYLTQRGDKLVKVSVNFVQYL